MPRAPSEKQGEAKKLFLEEKPLVDIAKQLGIPEGTVRSWKNRGRWGVPDAKKNKRNVAKKKDSEDADKNATLQKKKRGGQPGNKNAKGGKGNPNPTKPLKHGGYSAIYWDTLDEEEREMIEDMQTDPEYMLIQQIQLFTVRERKLMKAIAKYRDADKLYVSMSSTEKNVRKFKSEEEEEQYNDIVRQKVEAGERMPGENVKLYTQTQATDDLVNRLQRELTSVQSQKTKAINALSEYRFKKMEIEAESSGNDAVDDWIAAVEGGWEDGEE